MQWKLFWSPEGKQIATVEADSYRQAVRKAPKPYRKYLGEVYAEPESTNAFVAIVELESEGFLLGGTRKHVSSAFTERIDAQNWAEQSASVNRARTGYEQASINVRIKEVYTLNRIPACV